jgi:hypothetical protein
MKIQREMECWAFILTVALAQIERADMSALRTGPILPLRKFPSVRGWMGIRATEYRQKEQFTWKLPRIRHGIEHVTSRLWHRVSTNCGTTHPRNSKGNFKLRFEINTICILIYNRTNKYPFLGKVIMITFTYLELRQLQTKMSLKYI